MAMKPCLICGRPSARTRCPACQSEWNRARNARRVHYHGDYATRAAKVRAEATECWLCGGGHDPADPWQADHVVPGDPNSELRPAHRSCNSRRGNRT